MGENLQKGRKTRVDSWQVAAKRNEKFWFSYSTSSTHKLKDDGIVENFDETSYGESCVTKMRKRKMGALKRTTNDVSEREATKSSKLLSFHHTWKNTSITMMKWRDEKNVVHFCVHIESNLWCKRPWEGSRCSWQRWIGHRWIEIRVIES